MAIGATQGGIEPGVHVALDEDDDVSLLASPENQFLLSPPLPIIPTDHSIPDSTPPPPPSRLLQQNPTPPPHMPTLPSTTCKSFITQQLSCLEFFMGPVAPSRTTTVTKQGPGKKEKKGKVKGRAEWERREEES